MNKTESQFVGIINQINESNKLSFYMDKHVKCSLEDVVYIHSENDDNYIVAKIIRIDINYYLSDINQFFISKAADNKLESLVKETAHPRFGYIGYADIIGEYRFVDNSYKEIEHSDYKYTPKVFQPVFLIDPIYLPPFFNLLDYTTDNSNSINFGYLIRNSVSFPAISNDITFNKHTLITGITGSGKSRLALNIISQLSNRKAHISILDPHDEYTTLLDKNAPPETRIFKFKKKYSNKAMASVYKRVAFRNISFKEDLLDASSLSYLLPNITPQQEDCLYEIFDEIEKNSIRSVLNKLIEKINIDLAKEVPDFKQNITNEYETIKIRTQGDRYRLIEAYTQLLKNKYKEKVTGGKASVYIALIQKLLELVSEENKDLISPHIQNWCSIKSPNTIDILNIDYTSSEYIRRFINSFLQFLLKNKSEDTIRLVVIDEAHLLLKDEIKENPKTKHILIRLLREARKYNTSLIFITQNETDLPPEMRSQIQNTFYFRDMESDRRYLQDQICSSKLYGGKLNFTLRVKDFE